MADVEIHRGNIVPVSEDAGRSPVFIESLTLRSLLSFGPNTQKVPLRALNVIVGPNGSGKTNFIEAISLLQAAPSDLAAPIRRRGGVSQWFNKREKSPVAMIEALVRHEGNSSPPLRHYFGIDGFMGVLSVMAEAVFVGKRKEPEDNPREFIYANVFPEKGLMRNGELVDYEPLPRESGRSILSELRDPQAYPELTYLGDQYRKIKLYRSWPFGPESALRNAQGADQPNDFLNEDYTNLALVLNRLKLRGETKSRILKGLSNLMPSITNYEVLTEGGTVQLFIEEGDFVTPAIRLSDGTLRWLCLLTILLHPTPPPLIVIEEPELGLHPDLLPTLADLLKDASTRTQLIITTHSDILIDAFTDTPENVLVAEKENGETTLRRLDGDELKPWLAKYRLGQLWMKGEIGGTRW